MLKIQKDTNRVINLKEMKKIIINQRKKNWEVKQSERKEEELNLIEE